VILLDEIEKAHPEIFNILLQVMDDGHLTDSQGRHVDFRNVILILTSNVGTGHTQKIGMGFDSREIAQSQIQKERVEKELKEYFRPEFLNRLDEVVVFQGLTKEELIQIIDLLFEKIKKRLKDEKNISLALSQTAKEFILSEGTQLAYGARPLRRALQRYIENPLATLLLKGDFKEPDQVTIELINQKIEFVKK
jgi:ATP-dependent Clp protease ATP-binding subunit ClpC